MESLMTCQEFLARHAEYMDELIPAAERALWEAHISTCSSCARYDRVIRQGTQLLRESPRIEPSSDFFPRLQHRLYTIEYEMRSSSRGPGAMTSLAIAGVLALLAWSPLLRLDKMLVQTDSLDTGVTASTVSQPTASGVGRGLVGEAGQGTRFVDEVYGSPSFFEGSRREGRDDRWRRVEFTGPSAIRPLEVADGWSSPRPRLGGAGWGGAPRVETPFQLVPNRQVSTPTSPDTWWWSGASQRYGAPSPAEVLVQPRENLYPPTLTSTRAAHQAPARMERTADSVSAQH